METNKAAIDKIAWVLLLSGAFIDTFAITLIKVRLNDIGAIDYSTLSNLTEYCRSFFQTPLAFLSVITLMFSPLLPFIAISRIQISVAYPVLVALHLIFIETFSHLLLHEPTGKNKTLGVCCILISIFFFFRENIKQPLRVSE